MSKVEFELNRPGVSQLLKSKEAADVCAEFANIVRGRCGDGYEVTAQIGGKTRSNASVAPATPEAWRETLENNTIEKALY